MNRQKRLISARKQLCKKLNAKRRSWFFKVKRNMYLYGDVVDGLHYCCPYVWEDPMTHVEVCFLHPTKRRAYVISISTLSDEYEMTLYDNDVMEIDSSKIALEIEGFSDVAPSVFVRPNEYFTTTVKRDTITKELIHDTILKFQNNGYGRLDPLETLMITRWEQLLRYYGKNKTC